MGAKKQKKISSHEEPQENYNNFNQINGEHPLQEAVPTSVVKYQVRERKGGRITAFNFKLAKELGLINKNHPEVLNTKLEEKILDTFAIIIINEFDLINEKKFPKSEIKPNEYMATRYVQLQHENKQGKTSGDGRSIWNGQLKFKGKSYDISSCGTGATKLSPATAKFNKYFESGDPSISYGCGYSEKDEGLSTLFMSEILSQNSIPTERVLAVLEFEKGYSINVRVHENLLRPSHLFLYLKQNKLEKLRDIVDYYIEKQEKNKTWKGVPTENKKKYQYFLEQFSMQFAKVTADFEDEYIFCWLDWDGDNILMDGSIIDYGSVRQFGLYHSEYRYDDQDRYSTNIVEQKYKAKSMIQTMAQLTNFLIKGKRAPRTSFAKDRSLKLFDEEFRKRKVSNLIFKLGIDPKYEEQLLNKCKKELLEFEKAFRYFEKSKSVTGPEEVADGINWNAIFCMRDILREIPQIFLVRDHHKLKNHEFMDIIKSTYATEDDLVLNDYRKKMIHKFQKNYLKIIEGYADIRAKKVKQVLLEVSIRSSLINKYDRITGDSITKIVQTIANKRPKLKASEISEFLNELVVYQTLDPSVKLNKLTKKPSRLINGALKIVKNYREGL